MIKIFLFFTLFTSLLVGNTALQKGQKIYENTCIFCHGLDGKAQTDMDLLIKPRRLDKTILTQMQMFKVIKNGAFEYGAHASIMPAFIHLLGDEEISNVSKYVSITLNENAALKRERLVKHSQIINSKQRRLQLQIGNKLFLKSCAKCHGDKGDAKSKYIEQSKRDKRFIYPYNLTKTLLTQEQLFLFAKYGAHFWGADKHDMPAWGTKYSDMELKSIAKYIQDKIKVKSKTSH